MEQAREQVLFFIYYKEYSLYLSPVLHQTRELTVIKIFKGRYTADISEPFVVFLIGMRINKFLAFHKWWSTFQAMRPMLQALYRNPRKGLLGVHTWIRWREIMLVQYWRSFDDLEGYARNPNEAHLPAWKRFNETVGSDGSVGIWHETYLVDAKKYECVYNNMPKFGLAQATKHFEAIGNRETARLRIGGTSEPAVPSPPQPKME